MAAVANFLPIVAIGLVFYFLVIAPANKQRKKQQEMLSTLNIEHGLTVLVSLHQVDIAMQYCQRTIAMRRGKVVYDGPSAALTPTLLQKLYGDDARELLDDSQQPDSSQQQPVPSRPPAAHARAPPAIAAATRPPATPP